LSTANCLCVSPFPATLTDESQSAANPTLRVVIATLRENTGGSRQIMMRLTDALFPQRADLR
ncbi:MAG TPA: hypothetical protein VNO32_45150, partial [Candidatus Acidoferrum sp.]|nr:hypothetical protein [Candidatus Acidoferrum sp.]